jgi:hypothetical protein
MPSKDSSRFFTLLTIALLLPVVMLAQSTTNGAITGTVTDPSGAVLPDINVNLKSLDKGFTQATTTNSQGFYQFPLLEPGSYSLTISAAGFKTATATTLVSVGQSATFNARLEVGAQGTTVEVSGEVPLLQTESAEISTTFNEREISEVPNPGNDLSYVAQTAAGSVMNTGMGMGNFASYGISASSNLFTLNGMYDNDPFLNLNNSGATNLLLGNNEVQEATVVTNGYSGQYGGFAGANVNYITKSGSNSWHGNANYWWDGRAMNANNFFNVGTGTPRPFVNANQWAASVGGPIKKDKAFFFWNYEGLRVVIPTSSQVQVPSPAFETATLANLTGEGLTASIPFYQTMFSLYNGAAGIGNGVAGNPNASDTTGCGGFTFGALGGGGGACAITFRSTAGNFTHEFLTSGRFDFNLTNNDKVFVRLQEDKGLQATYTDPISPAFNADSIQPEYQGQISWNRAFGLKAANNVVFSAQWYQAIFGPQNLAQSLAVFPTTILLGDSSFATLGGINFEWPSGRNVTGYQVVDDFSYNLTSSHTLKLGVYFHRNDISDHDYGLYNSALVIPFNIADFYDGMGDQGGVQMRNFFPTSLDQPMKLFQLGLYAQDEWKVKSNLKLSLALRADHNSIPDCATNCFAQFSGPWDALDHAASTPYNQVIETGRSQAIPSFTAIAWQPRFGFSWSPAGLRNTVLRGGFGLFMDTFPGIIADSVSSNAPLLNAFQFNSLGTLSNGTAPFLAFAPQQSAAGTASGNVFTTAQASNSALRNGFTAGQTVGEINAATLAATGFQFSPPNFNNVSSIKAPVYQEWNFEVQHAFGNNTSLTVNYVGNHGTHEAVLFNGVNGMCPASICANGFLGLPSSQIAGGLGAGIGGWDGRFGVVTQIETAGISDYNGLALTLQHRFGRGLQMQANYTWSHALDDVSNGGFNQFVGNNSATGFVGSLLNPVNNQNLRQFNYGNADYDSRHYLSLNYVYELPKGPTVLLKGWQVSGTLFARSGLPFTVIDSAASNTMAGFGYGGEVYAGLLAAPSNCQSPSNVANVTCLSAANFAPPASTPGPGQADVLSTGDVNQRRNQFYGPRYFDTDLTVMKYTNLPHFETMRLGFGAQFFNLLNHPDFEPPVNDVNSGNFGKVLSTDNTPTSILGSFLGGDASPRLIQLTVKLNF